ncbi:MAG: 3'(2'),5'-bisphosphate nucleotidase CysQ [bacterium]
MMNEYLALFVKQVVEVAEQAGDAIMQIYQQDDFEVQIKSDKSPLTQADLQAHGIIQAGLQALSDYPILSEEAADIPFSERETWQTYWLVDPLDGTKQFISRKGEFCVCIALIHDHYPVLGVVHVPVTGETYFAYQGQGAYKSNKSSTSNEQQAAQTIACSTPQTPLRIMASRSHRGEDLERFLQNLQATQSEPLALQSAGSAIKACRVAEGLADLYPRLWLTSEWDTAAAQCIVEEAGGQFTDLKGERLAYNTKESLLNPYFFVFGKDSLNWQTYL